MTVKMTGAEFKRFLQADWGPDAMWEDYVLAVNGEVRGDNDDRADADVADADLITIEGGYIFPDQNDVHGETAIDAEKFARKWLKAQTTTSLIIEADKTQVEAIKAILTERFGKAVKVIAP